MGWAGSSACSSHRAMLSVLLHRATAWWWKDPCWKFCKARIHSHGVSRLQESAVVGVSYSQPSDELGVSMVSRELLSEDTWFPDTLPCFLRTCLKASGLQRICSWWTCPGHCYTLFTLKQTLATLAPLRGDESAVKWHSQICSLFVCSSWNKAESGDGYCLRVFCQPNGLCEMSSRQGNPGVEWSSLPELCQSDMLGWASLHDKGKN